MDELISKAESWIEKLRTTTKLVEDLSPDIKLPNGWGKREICIHLMGWDIEFLKFADELRKGKPYHSFFEGKENEYNKNFFVVHEILDQGDLMLKFKETRTKMIKTYEEILAKHPQNNKEFVGFFSLWWHDVHHLKQAGVDVKDLQEQ